MHNFLHHCNQGSIDDREPLVIGHNLSAFREQAENRRTFVEARLNAEQFENLPDRQDLALRFHQMGLKRRPQLRAGGSLNHFREGDDEPFFGIVPVRQFVQQNVVEGSHEWPK